MHETPISKGEERSSHRYQIAEETSSRQQVHLDHLDMLPAAKVNILFAQHGRDTPVYASEINCFDSFLKKYFQWDPSHIIAEMNSFRPVRECGDCGKARHNRKDVCKLFYFRSDFIGNVQYSWC